MHIGLEYTRKTPCTAYVEDFSPNEYDGKGKKIKAGYVRYRNDFGAICIMSFDEFNDLYELKG